MNRRFEFEAAHVSDEALLAGLGAGDAEIARAFVKRYQSRVYGVAFQLLRDLRLAEDVAQEAFVRAYRHADGFDARRGTVTGWLLRITRNVAIDTLRIRQPELTDPSDLDVWDVAGNESVEEHAMTSSAVSEVRTALQQLPREQARALLLAAFHGYTAHEISVAECIPLGTAKTRIRSALRKTRALLDPVSQPAKDRV